MQKKLGVVIIKEMDNNFKMISSLSPIISQTQYMVEFFPGGTRV